MNSQYKTPLACFKRAPVKRQNSVERALTVLAVESDEREQGIKPLTVVQNAEMKLLR